MRIAVTGASGFIGGRVARALAADGHEVLSFGRRPAGRLDAAPPGYRSWDLTAGPLPALAVDAVVHCAAAVGQWGPAERYHQANVEGTRHLLDSLPQDARVVLVSSASVYAKGARTTVDEDAPLDGSLSAYTRSKVGAERLVLARAPGAVVLRPHVVYGPADTTLWPRLRRACRGGVLRVPGNGRGHLSVTHVDNLVDAVRGAIVPAVAPGCYNVADAETPTVDALLRTILARQGMAARLRYVPTPAARLVAAGAEVLWRLARIEGEPPLTRYAVASLASPLALDIKRARTLLGYRPRWTIESGPL